MWEWGAAWLVWVPGKARAVVAKNVGVELATGLQQRAAMISWSVVLEYIQGGVASDASG